MRRKAAKIEWEEIARRGKAFALLFIESVFELYRRGCFGRTHGVRWNPRYYRQFNDARWFSRQEMEQYRRILEEGERKRPGYLLRNAAKYAARHRAAREFVQRYRSTRFAKLSNVALARMFTRWFEITLRYWEYAYDYIFINKFIPDEITAAVAAREPDVMMQTKYLTILFSADRPVEIWEEKRSILMIVQRVRAKKLRLNSDRVQSMIEYHLRRFAHLGYHYFRGAPYSAKQIHGRLREYTSMSNAEFARVLGGMKAQARNALETKRVLRTLHLDHEIARKVQIARRWAYLSNYADETYNYMVHHLRSMFEEIARRIGLSFEELVHLRAEEITHALRRGRLSPNLKQAARERVHNHAIILEQGRVRVLSGRALRAYTRHERKAEVALKGIRELRGQAASPGIVRGRVRLVLTHEDLPKVKRGEILVTHATNPMFVPAMEKAKAIVTNEGGLLSHAAIVSREFKIPCVVGIKVATQVFKDGERVEVDAEKGIVRKL